MGELQQLRNKNDLYLFYFIAPFLWMGFNCLTASASLLFPITKFPEIPGTHFIDLGRMKG